MSTPKKSAPKIKSLPNQQTYAFKDAMRIGGAIAAVLPQKMTQQQVAEKLRITQQMVSRIERLALCKLQKRLRDLLRGECVSNETGGGDDAPKTPVVSYEDFSYSSSDV